MRVGQHIRLLIGTCAVALSVAGATRAQPAYRPGVVNLAAREWFQNARFGLFVHWGVYSVLGDGEWVMNNRRIPAADYEKLPALFNPTDFDAAEWVALAKAAGMKYITITSKHHDGFAMFDSKVSDYNVVARTPYKKDVLKALADECRRQGLKLFFYYSQLDWHHADYFPRGRTGRDAGRPEQGEWSRYIDYMDGQLRELLTNYGDIGGIWFDGWWDRPDADWRLDHTYALIRYLVRAAGSNANFLLNVGPMPNGRIQPEFVTRLREMGAWLAKNGDAIYGTRGGPLTPQPWGVTTRRGNRVYVHVFDAPETALLIPPLGARVRSARLLGAGRAAEFSEHEFGIVVKLPAEVVDPIDTIVALDLDAKS